MTFIDWMNMSMIVDIALVVYAAACTWKIRKLQGMISKNSEDIFLVTKNPQAARRKLNNIKK